MLILLLAYLLLAGGTYNGSILFSLQRANFFLIGLIGFSWLAWRFWKRQEFPATHLDWPILIWLLASLLTAIFSTNPRLSLEGFTSTLVYALFFYLVVDLIRAGWPERMWLRVVLVSSLVVVLFGVFEVVSWHLDWLAIGGWSHLFPPATMRARGTLGHPNIAAAYMNLLLPIGLSVLLHHFIIHDTKKTRAWLLIPWVMLILLLLYFTSSRGGWLGTAAAILIFVGLITIDQKDKARKFWTWLIDHRRMMAGTILGGAAVTALAVFLLLRQIQHPSHVNTDPRGYIWSVALEMFARNPLIGNGPGTYGFEFMRNYSIPPGMMLAHAHSFTLNTLGEMGLLGALALLGLFTSIFWIIWRRWKSGRKGERILIAGLIASLAGLAVHSQFETPQTIIVINSVTAIILGLLAAPLPIKSRSVRIRSSASWPLIVGYTLALLLMGWSLYAYSAFSQGLAASYRGDWQGAARWIDETLRREPRLAYYWFQDGFAHGTLALNSNGSIRDEAELRLALKAYEHGLDLENANSLNWANLGWLRWAAQDRAGGLSAMEQAIKIAPDSSILKFYLARMYEEDRQDNKALEVYHQVLALVPDWADNPYFQSTELRRNSLETMLVSDAETQDGWNALDADNYPLAEDLFRANLGVNDARNHLGLGLALLGQDDLSGAEIALRTAQFIDSGLVEVFDAQIRLYEKMGDSAQASEAAARAKALRDHPSSYNPGIMGESGVAWYIYHRETLPADLLPGLMVGWEW